MWQNTAAAANTAATTRSDVRPNTCSPSIPTWPWRRRTRGSGTGQQTAACSSVVTVTRAEEAADTPKPATPARSKPS